MIEVDKKIEVEVPVTTAYNQWTQFEEFPRFMEGVQEVRQEADQRVFWKAEVGGKTKQWAARITRQVPDHVLAWESENGATNSGTVIFKPTDAGKTEIELHMSYDPEDFQEQVGGALGFLSRRVEGDLKRFKEFIEERGRETGAWRGEIAHGEVQSGSTSSGGMTGTTPRGSDLTGRPAELDPRGTTGTGGGTVL